MHRLLFLLCLLFVLPAGADVLDTRPAPSLSAQQSRGDFLPVNQAFRLMVENSQPETVRLRFIITEGYYLYRHSLKFQVTPSDVTLADSTPPPGTPHHDEYFGDSEVYYAIADVELSLHNPRQTPFTLAVTYQGCAEKGLCYAPETKQIQIDGSAAFITNDTPSATRTDETSSRSLLFFFLAGLALTFTPCVLPMLPILSGVILHGKPGGTRGLTLSLAFVLPMALCFAALGALMGLFGASLNLQAQLQSPWILGPFALFFAVFALAMFGFFELRLPAFIRDPLDRFALRVRGGSLLNAAVLGVISSLLVSPCVSAPLAAILLYISSTGDAWGGALQLFVLGIGMGTPLVMFGAGGGALLPKAGAWMEGVRNLFGVMLLGVAIWLLERIIPAPLSLALWGALAGGCGLALGALEFTPKNGLRRLMQLIGLMLLVYAAMAWAGAIRGESDPLAPLGRVSTVEHQQQWIDITTASQLDAALNDAQMARQPVLLDWYADWCVSCKVIERQVLVAPEVQSQLNGYRLIRLDITDSTAEQRALLTRFGLFGPPALLLFASSGEELSDLRLIGEIDAATLSAHLQAATVR